MLSQQQLREYRDRGHVTVAEVFGAADIRRAVDDVVRWSDAFRRELTSEKAGWYLEGTSDGTGPLRKLDNPVFYREVFRDMAKQPRLVSMVEQIVGAGVSVFFSQLFLKPPEVGGPKPVHQDNFYFGPDDPEATLTVWIALDEATVENGCLYYADGSHQHGVLEHVVPPEEPFNWQVPTETMGRFELTPAPVPAGGVSFHHGNTLHQSSRNTSPHPRRAAAFHYLRHDARLTNPALAYDPQMVVAIS